MDTARQNAFGPTWFFFASVDEISKKQPYYKIVNEEPLVGFVDASGKVVVTQGHCPHFGANLGKGGVVRNGNLTCPFHAWEFDSNGNLINCPHDPNKKPNVKLKLYPTRIENQDCFVQVTESLEKSRLYPDQQFPLGWYQVARAQEFSDFNQIVLKKWFGSYYFIIKKEDGSFFMGRVDPSFLSRFSLNLLLTQKHGVQTVNGFQQPSDSVKKKIVSDSQCDPGQTLVEYQGILFYFYHPRGLAPTIPFPREHFLELPNKIYRVDHDIHLGARFQDVSENGTDVGHFSSVHKTPQPAQMLEVSKDPTTFKFEMLVPIPVLGLFPLTVLYKTTYYGPGIYETLAPTLGKSHFIVYACGTPVDFNEMVLQWTFMLPHSIIPFVNWINKKVTVLQHDLFFSQDRVILENKIRRKNDILMPSDKTLLEFRNWLTQFDA